MQNSRFVLHNFKKKYQMLFKGIKIKRHFFSATRTAVSDVWDFVIKHDIAKIIFLF